MNDEIVATLGDNYEKAIEKLKEIDGQSNLMISEDFADNTDIPNHVNYKPTNQKDRSTFTSSSMLK